MITPRISAFTPLVAALLVAACGGDGPQRSGDPGLDADVRVSPTPAVVGESRVFVRATDAGRPLAGGTVRVRAEAVDTAGGGVAAPAGALPPGVDHAMQPSETGDGDYGPVVLHFPAPGNWRLHVEIQIEDRSTSLTLPLAVVGGPGG